MRRGKEVQTDDVLGPLGHGRYFIDIQIGCVARQHCTLFANSIQFGEKFLFDSHIFKSGFNHQIYIGKITDL